DVRVDPGERAHGIPRSNSTRNGQGCRRRYSGLACGHSYRTMASVRSVFLCIRGFAHGGESQRGRKVMSFLEFFLTDSDDFDDEEASNLALHVRLERARHHRADKK